MAETLCPSCGFGPIPEGSDDCPKCKTQFAANPLYRRSRVAGGHGHRKDEADLEATRTTLGGVTDAVTAHPLPSAAVLAGCAIAWIFRSAGIFSDVNGAHPSWPFAVAAFQMGVAMLLMVSAGPSRYLAQMMAIAQVASAYFVGGSIAAQIGFGGAGLSLLSMTIGEAGDIRRYMGAGAAIACLVVGVWGST
jgi:hypothetical protein